MPDLMAKGAAWLARMRRRHCSVPVVYERAGATEAETRRFAVPAALGRPEAEAEASVPSLRIDAGDLDFLVAAADLALDGVPFEPGRDDRIVLTAGGQTHVYHLLPQGGDPPWRWSDPQKTTRRIHARCGGYHWITSTTPAGVRPGRCGRGTKAAPRRGKCGRKSRAPVTANEKDWPFAGSSASARSICAATFGKPFPCC